MQLAGEVLDRVLAQVLENRRHTLAQHGLHGMRHRQCARAGQAFQPRGDVDAIAVHRAISLFNHVADMDTDAELQPPVCRGAVFGQYLLHGQRGLHSRHGTVKHRQHRVTSHVDDAAVERRDLLAEDRAGSVQGRHRGAVVHRHQARIASHISGHDGEQAVAQGGDGHGRIVYRPGSLGGRRRRSETREKQKQPSAKNQLWRGRHRQRRQRGAGLAARQAWARSCACSMP